MDNHYHLMIETPDGNLCLGMRQLNGVYTQLFNKRHRRAGHLFQGRYKSILIQKESQCRYVVLNPVRARMVERPEVWKWSSYLATSGRGSPALCLTTDWILGQFSRTRGKAEKKYILDKGRRDAKILEAVQKHGYTQQQIAAHLNLHYSTISNLVRGKV